MKRVISLALLGFPSSLFALPQGGEAVEGKVDFAQPDSQTLLIQTHTDKAILNYDSFNIGENEKVQFIQPSSSSCVLNRIQSGNPSEILGHLSANGKVFLVNPFGIYFGPHAVVQTASLIASTLDIADQDFLDEKYEFLLQGKGSIVNSGLLSAPEGAIVLLAPYIQNKGTIIAEAGKIVCAAGERVALDFTGDGLLKFTVEGELEEAIFEHLGKIQALKGEVALAMKAAGRVLMEVVNTQGLEEAHYITKENGVVRLASSSQIATSDLKIRSSDIDLAGEIVVQGDFDVRGSEVVRIRDSLEAPFIAEVKGNFYLEGIKKLDFLSYVHPQTHIASGGNMKLVSENSIALDAHVSSGGRFDLCKPDGRPADFVSLYDPIISATGSVAFAAYTGVSLKVESTGEIDVSGDITITGPDPVAPLGDTDGATMQASAACILRAGVALQGFGTPIPPTTVVGGTNFMTVGGGTPGNIQFNNPGLSITISATSSPATIILQGNVVLNANLALLTHVVPASGGPITITGSVDGVAASTNTLEFNAGLNTAGSAIGDISVTGTIGATNNMGAISIDQANNATFGGSISAQGSLTQSLGAGTTTFNGAITLSAGGNLNLTGTAFTFSSPVTTTGGGSATINNAGTLTMPVNMTLSGFFNQSGVGNVILSNTLQTNDAAITFTGPVTLVGTTVLNTVNGSGGAVHFASTIDGTQNLTVTAGTGNINFSGDIGVTTPLANLTASNTGTITIANVGGASSGVTGTLSLTTTSSIHYTGTTYFANIEHFSAGSLNIMQAGSTTTFTATSNPTFTGQIQLTAGTNLVTNGSSGNLTISGIHGTSGENITINAGSGTVQIGNATGSLGNLSITAGQIVIANPIITATTTMVSSGSILNLAGSVTMIFSGNATFNALTGNVGSLASPLNVNAGGQIFAGANGGNGLVDIIGSSSDNTVHAVGSNPPCTIIFNDVVLQNCVPPPGPLTAAQIVANFGNLFYVAGIYSPQNSLVKWFNFDWIDKSNTTPSPVPISGGTIFVAKSPRLLKKQLDWDGNRL